ncbi:MAG: hypothetical protein WDZ31_05360 [Phycisphaeraceae bacterium]
MRCVLLIVVAVSGVMPGTAGAFQWIAPPNPPEPTRAALLEAAGVADADAAALQEAAFELLGRSAFPLDTDLPHERQREYQAAIAEAWASTPAAQINEWKPRPSEEALEETFASLRERRLADPVRHMDAVLRELGEEGGAAQVEPLLTLADQAHTPWGRWKPLAAAQEILHRVEPADVLPERAALGGKFSARLPLLIRDLPPDKAGAWAAAIVQLYETSESPWHTLDRLPLSTRLWLAWSLSDTEPDRARQLIEPGLSHVDPALRLMAGLALARMTDDRPPYRLTASPADAAAERQAWVDELAKIDLVPPQPFQFVDPLALPVPVPGENNRGSDMIWLDAQAQVVERERNVGAHALRVLPDGTFLSMLGDVPSGYHGPPAAGLIAPTGEPLVRLTGAFNTTEPASHGGTFHIHDRSRLVVETDVFGRVIWACRSSEQVSFAGPAERGGVLLLRDGNAEVVDRRGETIWAVEYEGDPRWAAVIGEGRVIVCGKQTVRIIDREAGVVQTLDGFTSLSRLRYHPDRPWMIFDAAREIVIYDPQAGTRHAYPLR